MKEHSKEAEETYETGQTRLRGWSCSFRVIWCYHCFWNCHYTQHQQANKREHRGSATGSATGTLARTFPGRLQSRKDEIGDMSRAMQEMTSQSSQTS